MRTNLCRMKYLLAVVAFASTLANVVAQNAQTSAGVQQTSPAGNSSVRTFGTVTGPQSPGGQQTAPSDNSSVQSSGTFNGSRPSLSPGVAPTPQAPGGIQTPQAPGGNQTPQAPGGTLVPPPGSTPNNTSQFITNGSGGFFTNGFTAGTFTNGAGTSTNGTSATFTNGLLFNGANSRITNSDGTIIIQRNNTNGLRRQPLNNPQ